IAQPPHGDLHCCVRYEEGGGEEPDEGEPDAVVARRLLGDGADVREVESRREREREAGEEGTVEPHPREPSGPRGACGTRASCAGSRTAASSTTSPTGSASCRRTTSGSCGTPS